MGTSDPFRRLHYRCAVGTSTVTPVLSPRWAPGAFPIPSTGVTHDPLELGPPGRIRHHLVDSHERLLGGLPGAATCARCRRGYGSELGADGSRYLAGGSCGTPEFRAAGR